MHCTTSPQRPVFQKYQKLASQITIFGMPCKRTPLVSNHNHRQAENTIEVPENGREGTVRAKSFNESRPSISFMMELATNNNEPPFIGREIEMKGNQLATHFHRKTTNKGLLLHYQSR